MVINEVCENAVLFPLKHWFYWLFGNCAKSKSWILFYIHISATLNKPFFLNQGVCCWLQADKNTILKEDNCTGSDYEN